MSEETYAGDLSVKKAWDLLSENPKAQLVDVRTDAEFAYVGSPDLSSLGKEVLSVQWKIFPAMDNNPEFIDQVSGNCVDKDAPLLFLCRSGARSLGAAEAMTAAGFRECYNVAGGFEGDRDAEGHRGTVTGWKADGLPWRQG